MDQHDTLRPRRHRFGWFLLLLIALLVIAYLLAWPTGVAPLAWQAPRDNGYTGPFAVNTLLDAAVPISIGPHYGPESVAVAADGRIYTTSHAGDIVRLKPDGTDPEDFVNTKGLPLGLKFGPSGNLYVADAARGLLEITPAGAITVVVSEVDGTPVRYADDLAVGSNGKVYFSDATTKFGASQNGGTYEASLKDILEHGGHGRVLVWDPASKASKTLAKGINFANGVALAPDESFLLVNETGSYRVLRIWLTGPDTGKTEPFIENLPGFPDNITTGLDGRFWVALVSPRNALVDKLSGWPFVRAILQRMPAVLRPKATAYGHVVGLDNTGRVIADLQSPSGKVAFVTSALETPDALLIGSLLMPTMARLPKTAIKYALP